MALDTSKTYRPDELAGYVGGAGETWNKKQFDADGAKYEIQDVGGGLRRVSLLSGSPTSNSSSSSGGGSYEEILRRQIAANQEANKPAVQSLEASIPEIQNKTKTQSAQLEAEKEPLKARYDNLIATIKGKGQTAVNRQTTITSNELGKRGLSGDSTLAQQEISNAVQPIESEYTGMEKDAGLAREADLRDLVNKITNLGTQETEQTRAVRNAIAQILAGGNTNAATQALTILGQNQQQEQFNTNARLQQEQLKAQQAQNAIDTALKEKQVNYETNKPYYQPQDNSFSNLFTTILGNKSTTNSNGKYIASIGKSVVGYLPDGRALYSDGSAGWTNAKK